MDSLPQDCSKIPPHKNNRSRQLETAPLPLMAMYELKKLNNEIQALHKRTKALS